MLRSLVGSEMCIRDRYQRRVRGPSIAKMVMGLMDEKHENKFAHLNSLVGSLTLGEHLMEIRTSPDFSGKVEIRMGLTWSPCFVTLKGHFLYIWTNDSHGGVLHQVFPIIRAGVDMVERDKVRQHCIRILRQKFMLVLSCADAGAAKVWLRVLETASSSKSAKKALRKAVSKAACKQRERNAVQGDNIASGSWQLDAVEQELEEKQKAGCTIL
eukprot:TRINITY_DN9541_c0_g1_i4.p1 TRINITY_DN9541_c0_g1~~TRINITY_DN9541_c0_g1_i4.p1  ORF type:complete len:213 (+),score=65.89 TRINITY_DN9541_c0_g1_i4:163-801(+)